MRDKHVIHSERLTSLAEPCHGADEPATFGRVGGQTTQSLFKREEIFSEIFRFIPDFLIVTSFPDGMIMDVNDRFLHLMGFSRDEVIGKTTRDLGTWMNIEDRDTFVRTVQEKGEFVDFNSCFRTKGGRVVYLSASGGLIAIQGEPCVVSIARDITHEFKLERQLLQAQKMEAIGTLAGGIAHDFNNILSVIIGYSQLLQGTAVPGSRDQERLKEILMAGNRAKDLVRQILTFSRQTEQEMKPVHISPIINEALKFLRASLPSTVEIRKDIRPSSDIVLADPTRIHQVLMNLCTNAAHAMKEKGGVLEVTLSSLDICPETDTLFTDVMPGAYVRLTVKDSGSGMSPEIMERIFDPYFTTKDKGEGTGLGLSVVHGIVKNHGGTVTVSSEPGRGTSCEVLLPCLDAQVSSLVDEGASVPYGTERILFVDDEEMLVTMGKEMLERLGYAVVAKMDSGAALDVFMGDPAAFDAVITDKTMPGMTGFELAANLLRIRPDIPVIMCTGFSDTTDAEKVQALGIRELVMKPLVMRELAETIRRVLDKKNK